MARKRNTKTSRSTRAHRPKSGVIQRPSEDNGWINTLHVKWKGETELRKSA